MSIVSILHNKLFGKHNRASNWMILLLGLLGVNSEKKCCLIHQRTTVTAVHRDLPNHQSLALHPGTKPVINMLQCYQKSFSLFVICARLFECVSLMCINLLSDNCESNRDFNLIQRVTPTLLGKKMKGIHHELLSWDSIVSYSFQKLFRSSKLEFFLYYTCLLKDKHKRMEFHFLFWYK